MKKAFSIVVLLAFGCASTSPVVQYPGIDKSEHVEKEELPDRPDSKPIPEVHDWIYPLLAGKIYPSDGVLLSPEKAVRAKEWELGYLNLRETYEKDRETWVNHRIVYEGRRKAANKTIERLSPTWWSNNKTTVGILSGVAAGIAASIGIFQATN